MWEIYQPALVPPESVGQNENLEAGGYFGRRLAPLYSSSLGFKQIVQELYHFMEWKKVVENPYFLIANFSTHDPFPLQFSAHSS